MADLPGLEWLTVGVTVAYITGGHRRETVHSATVDRVGKRDVVVTADGREQRFSIGNTTQRDQVRWLSRSVGTWSQDTYLAPWDDPRVAAMRAARTETDAAARVHASAEVFRKAQTADAARALRAAVDAYLETVEEAK